MIGLLLTLLTLLTLALLVGPLLTTTGPPTPAAPARRAEFLAEKAALVAAIRELDFDYQAGTLAEADYVATRRSYEARVAALLADLDREGGGSPQGASSLR